MKRESVFLMVFSIILATSLSSALEVQRVEAIGTVYIRADGGIDPPDAPISTLDNVTYTLAGNVTSDADGIVVERDSIVLDGAGYTVTGNGSGYGTTLTGRTNVTLRNMTIENFAYGVWLSYSSDNTLSGNNFTANHLWGVWLSYSSDNVLSGNNVTANSHGGVWLRYCSYNTLSGNNVTANGGYGILLPPSGSYNNSMFHNGFVNNTSQVYTRGSKSNSIWDASYPSGGNYWSDYDGTDADHDGIGDTAYIIDGNNRDNYPLMGMFSDFNATSDYHVQTICNSTVYDFEFNGTAISFSVYAENGTTGFCRICIPAALMNGTYSVFVNGTEAQYDLLPFSNSTHNYLYFTYSRSTQEVIIIPEFPSFLILPLFFTATLLAVLIYRRKHVQRE